MRKQIVPKAPQQAPDANDSWLDLARLTQVEITSEDEAHPIESAFTIGGGAGWRAANEGEQTIRLVFDEPQHISRIHLLFREKEQARTQEYQLRWLPEGEQTYRELVRQQFNFSPPYTVEEAEGYTVALRAVRALEINIIPDINGGNARASIAQLLLS